jgi:hypothetical protein
VKIINHSAKSPGQQSDQQLDQTWFMEESSFIDKQEPQILEPAKTSKKKLYLLAGLGLAAAFVIGLLIIVLILRSSNTNTPQIILEETQETTPLGALERQLLILKNDIDTADPLDSVLAFPPVNFKLGLEDATLLQQK